MEDLLYALQMNRILARKYFWSTANKRPSEIVSCCIGILANAVVAQPNKQVEEWIADDDSCVTIFRQKIRESFVGLLQITVSDRCVRNRQEQPDLLRLAEILMSL